MLLCYRGCDQKMLRTTGIRYTTDLRILKHKATFYKAYSLKKTTFTHFCPVVYTYLSEKSDGRTRTSAVVVVLVLAPRTNKGVV